MIRDRTICQQDAGSTFGVTSKCTRLQVGDPALLLGIPCRRRRCFRLFDLDGRQGNWNCSCGGTLGLEDGNLDHREFRMIGFHAQFDFLAGLDLESHREVNGEVEVSAWLRLFNPKTKLWSLYWVASNSGVMDPPVVGSFENNVGHFFCKDTFQGKPIVVMFRWDARNKDRPIWGQAFSADNGKTWEWNMYNVSVRP